MSSSIIEFAPVALLIPPVEERRRVLSIPRTKAIQNHPGFEPEKRLWKSAGRPASRTRAAIELLILALCFLVALAVITDGFAELSRLLQTDSVGHVVVRAINGDA